MKATTFSKEPYYPMILSNGQDGIVVNYTGTNVCPISGHNYCGETLGVPCGWYKASSRAANGRCIAQIIRAGIDVQCYGASCMPNQYEQSFRPEDGVLITKLTFARAVHITVESFLTADGIWGEQITVEKCPQDMDVKIGFALMRTFSGYAWTNLLEDPTMQAAPTENGIPFSYTISGKKGLGKLWPSEPFETVNCTPDFFYGTTGLASGYFREVREGSVFSRLLTCVDETECADVEAEFAKREQIASIGYKAVKNSYSNAWRRRNGATWVHVPDERLQGVYDISRYHTDGNYNRRTGACSLGLLPHLWGGGLHCSCDVNFILAALLKAGNTEAPAAYKRFFVSQGKMGKEALAGIGMGGTAFTGWTNSEGGFARQNKDLAFWLCTDKPMFHFCEMINRYLVWKYTDRAVDAETREILEDAVSFAEERLLRKIDGRYHLIRVNAGTESGVCVEADTFTIVLCAAAFRGAAEMLGEDRLRLIADDVLSDLAGNYRADGTLMPHRDAPYTGGLQMDLYLYTLPDPIGIVSVDNALAAGKTPWGYTFEQTTEEKRHWPWIHSRAAICYANEGKSKAAFSHLLSIPDYCSAIGAIPEYIRMDGLPVNYWYTTAHALAVWAVHDAFAHVRKDTVRLLFGMTDAWQTFSCDELYLENRLTVSLRVEDGMLKKMQLRNTAEEDIAVCLSINPAFCPADCPQTCTVSAKETLAFSF